MSLKVFCGCMYSGKTRAMLDEVSRYADVSASRVLIINHALDTRNETAIISSHSSLYKGLSDKMDTVSTQTLSTVDVSQYTVIGIDEVNFFEEELVDTIKLWIKQGKHIICSGLDGDSNMNPFGHIAKLLCIADQFIKLNAICTLCVKELQEITPINVKSAAFTKKIIKDDHIIDIGGADKYIAVCRKHH